MKMKRILSCMLLLAIIILAGCRKEEKHDIVLVQEELAKINSYSNIDISYTIKADGQTTIEGQQIFKAQGDTQEMWTKRNMLQKYYTKGYMCSRFFGGPYNVIKMPFPGMQEDNPLRYQIDFSQYDYDFTIRDEPGRKIYTVLINDERVLSLIQKITGKQYPPNVHYPTTIAMKVELVIDTGNGILKTMTISATVTRGEIVQTMEMLASVNAFGEAVSLVIPNGVLLAIDENSDSKTN